MIYFFFRNEELSNAIFFDKLDDVSSEDRFRTIKYGFKAFKLRPIFGHGSKYMNVMHSIAGHEFSITNTYVANFVAFGSLFGLFVVVNLKRFVDSIKTSMISKLILYITFLLLFSSLSLIHSPLFSVLMFLRLNEEKKELVFNEEKILIVKCNTNDYISKIIKKRGYNIEPMYIGGGNKLKRFLRRLFLKYKLPFYKKWFNKKILNYDVEIVFFYDSLLSESLVEWVNDNMDVKIHVWYWNIVTNTIQPDKLNDEICSKWSFSSLDAKKYNMKFMAPYF